MLERNGELSDARRGLMRDMERYAASVGCRHGRLVGYFGETFAKAECGACDYCLGELESVADPVDAGAQDPVVRRARRPALRRRARVNVLRGSDSEQVVARGHRQLSDFGLLRDAPIDEVRGYIDQLAGARSAAANRRSVSGAAADRRWRRFDEGRAGAGRISRWRVSGSRRRASAARDRGVEAESWEGVDRDCSSGCEPAPARSRATRGVPPYVIFHDTTLRELARVKPRSLAELSGVYGMGAKKIDALGGVILETIRASA